MAYGIKVSKPRKNVLTCEDKDLILSSKWNAPKVKKVIELFPSWEDSGHGYYEGDYTFYHNFGFVPDVLTFAKGVNFWIEGEPEGFSQGVDDYLYVYTFSIDENKISGYLRGYMEETPKVVICFLEKFYDV